jgi:hypothetical protein
MDLNQKREVIAKAETELQHDMRMLALAYPQSMIPENLREAAEEKFLRVCDSVGANRPASYK